jgi:hypothetical protein
MVPRWLATCGRGQGAARSFYRSFHHGLRRRTGRYQLDGAPDLSCEDGTPRYAEDGGKATSNPRVGGSNPSGRTTIYQAVWHQPGRPGGTLAITMAIRVTLRTW